MQVKIDFRSGQPIYVQIMDQIQRMVASGALKPGDQLPTVRQLATELRVNFNTVARAYRLLDEAGLISTQQGRGTYIWEGPTEETMTRLRQQSLESITRQYIAEVSRLDYSPGEVMDSLMKALAEWQQHGTLPRIENKFGTDDLSDMREE
jgi:GntR family transcriptional regulator